MGDKSTTTTVEIKDSDIAIIERLHDLLLDEYGYHINHPTLERARELTEKMYRAFNQKHYMSSIDNINTKTQQYDR